MRAYSAIFYAQISAIHRRFKLHIIRLKQILRLCSHVEERLNKATLENKKRSMKRQLAPLLALLFTGLNAIAEQKAVNIVTVNSPSMIILKKLSTKFEAAKVSDSSHSSNCIGRDLRADGFRIVVYFKSNLIARVPVEHIYNPGEKLTVQLNMDKVLLRDGQTEKVITAG